MSRSVLLKTAVAVAVAVSSSGGTVSALIQSDYSINSSGMVSANIQDIRNSAGMAFTGVGSRGLAVVDAPAAFVPIYNKSGFSGVSGRGNVAELIPAYPKRPSSFRNVSDSLADEGSAFVKFKIMTKRFFVW